MTHASTPGHGSHGPASGQPYFPEAEWQAFQADDRHTTKLIVCLMTGIFLVGLLLYASVSLVIVS